MHRSTVSREQVGSGRQDRWTRLLAMVYLLVMLWVLLFKLGVSFAYMDERRVNLLPYRQLFTGQGRLDMQEIILNVLIFVPMGLYIAILFRRWTRGAQVLLVCLTTLLFEGIQFLARIGSLDATDLVNNALGGILGIGCFMLLERLSGHSPRAQKMVNILGMLCTIAVISFLLLLKLQLLPFRYQ